MPDVLVTVENVNKKFCRDLKRSLWYGVKDLAYELTGRSKNNENLRKHEFWALKNINFEVKRGECLALIGPNGAGKSTLLKMLHGLIKPDAGKITIRGRVGALIELEAGFNPILTGRENIYVNGAILGFSKKELGKKINDIVSFAEVSDFIDAPIQSYSSGMRIRLGFSIAAHLQPDILLIDEVLAVGDIGFKMKCFKHIMKLKDQGISIILVSHAIHQLSRVSDRVMVLHKGENFYDGGLSKGIGCYQNLLKTQDSIDHRNVNEGMPYIEYVRLMDDQGNDKEEFKTGDLLHAEIRIKSNKLIKGARLTAAIEAPAVGILGAFSTPYTNFHFDIIPPRTTIRLIMPNIPLLIGGYHLDLHLYGSSITDFYDRWNGATSFQVVGPPTDAYGFGINHIIKFDHKWEST
ncbi:MAG: ABC transporter ATP-binding protein [bacterium]